MPTDRLLGIQVLIVALALSAGRVEAQTATTNVKPGYQGFGMQARLVKTGPWTRTFHDPNFGAHDVTIESAEGIGLSFSYAVRPMLAFFVAGDLNLYGESGYALGTAGAEFRLALAERLVSSLSAGVGRFEDSGLTYFTLGVIDGGVEFFLFRRLAFNAGMQVMFALGDGVRKPNSMPPDGSLPVKVTLDNNPRRKRFGLSWYPGRQ